MAVENIRSPSRGQAAQRLRRLAGLALLAVVLSGCEESHDEPPAADVSGAWRTATWISAYVPGNRVQVAWTLTQAGGAIHGTFADNLNRGGDAAGSISGSKVFLTFTYWTNAGWVVTFEATVSSNAMSGAFRGEGEVKLGDAQRVLSAP